MKKIILILLFLFTTLSANATYTCTDRYCRTGYAHPKTRFAKPNKRFSQPQKRVAHVRPKYLYTSEYQKNIIKHKSGMKRQHPTIVNVNNNTSSRFNKNFQASQYKTISCSGIIYYSINTACKN